MTINQQLQETYYRLDRELLATKLQGYSTITVTHHEVSNIMNMILEVQYNMTHFPESLGGNKFASKTIHNVEQQVQ